MPAIIPLGELTQADKQAIRNAAKEAGINKAVEGKIASRENLVARDMVLGNGAVANFADITNVTAAVALQEQWLWDAVDLVADNLTNVCGTTAVPDSKVFVFFGFTDLSASPELTAIRFRRGSDDVDFWEVEQCYAYQNEVGGMIKGAILFEQNDPIQIQFNVSGGLVDLRIPLLAYVIERYGERISKAI